MTSRSSKAKTETVDVEVVVNHDDLRRGERGTVELTDLVRGRLDAGYLRLVDGGDSEPGMPPAAALGATARRGNEPRGVLLGVEGVPGSMVSGTGGSGDDSTSAGGAGTAGD